MMLEVKVRTKETISVAGNGEKQTRNGEQMKKLAAMELLLMATSGALVASAKVRSVALLYLFLALFALPSWGQTGPTATLSANGTHYLIAVAGTTINYTWSSANAVSAVSRYTVDGGVQNLWDANTLSGGLAGTIGASQLGHTYVLTYTVTDSSGQTSSDQDTITVVSSLDSMLSGSYAFVFTANIGQSIIINGTSGGYQPGSNLTAVTTPFAGFGTLVFDGSGHVTSGSGTFISKLYGPGGPLETEYPMVYDATCTFTLAGSTYSVNSDGTGTLSIVYPSPCPVNPIFAGTGITFPALPPTQFLLTGAASGSATGGLFLAYENGEATPTPLCTAGTKTPASSVPCFGTLAAGSFRKQ
jgi:hypothetical protein